jgi:hypothetical protein
VIFCNFITVFWLILVGILYWKDTNPVLTYPVFIKTSKIFKIKNVFCFQKISKISLRILLIFLHLLYQSRLIFGCIFIPQGYKPSIKNTRFASKRTKYILKKCFVLKYGLVSPIYIYKYYNIIFSHNKENFKNNICINMHFGFNNQFIKAMRTRPIFQKF